MKYMYILFTMFISCSHRYKEDAINFCRQDKNTIKIIYLDSTHGITKVLEKRKKNILYLDFKTDIVKIVTDPIVNINGIEEIRYGSKSIQIKDLGICKGRAIK